MINSKLKMQNFSFCLAILLFAFCIFNFSCWAQAISSDELINNAKAYDGKTIVYTGEVIGEVMLRGEFAWVNIFDGKNALGIWAAKDLVKEIQYAGSYKFKGDRVEVSGVFNRSCPQHGGDLDIHAVSLQKVLSGRAINQPLNISKRNFSLVLLGLLCLILILKKLRPA